MAEHILSLSYGKDSIACIEAIKQLGLPLDRIVHAEVWATNTIPADLPPMVEFKAHADKIIKARYGIAVEHVTATRERLSEEHGVTQCLKLILTYERMFYMIPEKRKDPQYEGKPTGFPIVRKPWCNSRLKVNPLTNMAFPIAPLHKELIQILCNILASLRTSRSALNGIQNRALFCHWYKSAGTKPTAGNGARKMICCRRYTPRQRGAGAGFATIRALTSCAYYAKTTPTCGRCC